MTKAALELLSERRSHTVLLGKSGSLTTLERIRPSMYAELMRYDDVYQYADAIPIDTSESFLHRIDAAALCDHSDQYYYDQLNTLIATIGQVGLELMLRFSSNGARLSTISSLGESIYGDEHFLSVSPSLYFSILDASHTIELLFESHDESYKVRRNIWNDQK